MQAPPEPKHTPPELMQQCNTGMQQRAKICSPCPGRLDRLHRAVRPPATRLIAWGAVRPPQVTGPAPNCSKIAQTNWNTFQTLPGVQNMHKLLPLVDNAWIKAKKRKVSTYSFSNIQNSSQGATQVQKSKLDTLQVRNDLNYKITKFHNHWTRLKRIWVRAKHSWWKWAFGPIWSIN
jgi:hypothetical protein